MTAFAARAAAAALVTGVAFAAAPAAAPAEPLIAAFERYNGANGFDIGLVNTATGTSVFVSGGVNSAADEFHPALTPDGRYLVFTRTALVGQPDGDVVPPATRELLMLDRQTGQIRKPFANPLAGAGATIVPAGSQSTLASGVRLDPALGNTQRVVTGGAFFTDPAPPGFSAAPSLSSTKGDLGGGGSSQTGTFLDFPHAAVATRSGRILKTTSVIRFNEGNGSIANASTFLADASTGATPDPHFLALPSAAIPRHPTPRVPDGHVALDVSTSSGTDIATIQFPGDSAFSPLSPVNTSDSERMPAWSPDGVQLGFVRTTGQTAATPKRKLLVFDSTLGLQTVVNPAVDIGGEAPTPQLREFQASWGGLSLARASSVDNVAIACGTVCGAAITRQATGAGATLSPTIGTATRVPVGIVIARLAGRTRLFGRTVPRIRAVGRVPLGVARSHRPHFRWNGRVNGRRLSAGTYYLTFRALTRRGRILDTSNSIRFRVARRTR